MFQSEKLIYIHMPKTAGSHIVKLLMQIMPGKETGKHNAATAAQINSANFFVSSIRNPWDWYLSLWAYGVQGDGAFANRLTRKNILHPVRASLRRPQSTLSYFMAELTKDVAAWRRVYENSSDVDGFRQWLRLITSRSSRICMGEGFSDLSSSQHYGFMTHRFLSLCCRNPSWLTKEKRALLFEELADYATENCYIDLFIRQESLERDLCEAIEHVQPLTEPQRASIAGAGRTNSSNRKLCRSKFYDQQSIELVYSSDRLLIDKFSYTFKLD